MNNKYIEYIQYLSYENIKGKKELIELYHNTIIELKKTTHTIEYKILHIKRYNKLIKKLLLQNYNTFKNDFNY